MRKPESTTYWLEDKPPVQISLLLALQQMSYLSVYLVVSPVLARALNLDESQSLQLISATLLASGVGVILQAVGRLGIGSGYFCPLQTTSATFGAVILGSQMDGREAIFGAMGVLGLSQIGFAYLFSKMRGIFNIQIAGLAIMLMGLMLGQAGLRTILAGVDGLPPTANDAIICGVTLGGMVVANISRFKYLRLFSAFIGLGLGTLTSFWLDAIDPKDVVLMRNTPLVFLPQPMYIGWSFSLDSLAPALTCGLFMSLHGFGALALAQRFNDADWKSPNMKVIRHGLIAEGLSNILSSILNGATITSSGGAVSLGAATGCTSRYVAYWLGGLMILLAFAPRFIIFVHMLPDVVMGCGMIFLSCFTTMTGLQIISSRLLDNRKILTISSGILFGISFDPLKDIVLGVVPEAVKPMLFSGVSVGVTCAVLLSTLFRIFENRHEKRSFDAHHSSLNEISSFLEQQGKGLGAQADVVRRSEYATWQAFEILLENELLHPDKGKRSLIHLETIMDEYHFSVILNYQGIAAPLAIQPPSHEELLESEFGVLQMAGYLLRRLADEVHMKAEGTQCTLSLVFND